MESKFICKDYTVSGKEFELHYNSDLDMYATFPQPSLEELPTYYESEKYISHTDSKKSMFDKTYQLVKNYAINKKVRLINSFQTKEKNVLDIGCGTGDFLTLAQKKLWKVVGVEPNQKARDLSFKKLGKPVYKDIQELKEFFYEKFDVISLWHVLEHVPDLDDYILNLKSLLKPDGYLIIAVPNYKSYDAQYYKEFWAAYDVPRHLWHFSKKSIKLLFNKVEMKIIKTLPMKFDSFYVSLLSEKYKNGKSNLLKAFWIGIVSNYKAKKINEYSSLIYVLKNIK